MKFQTWQWCFSSQVEKKCDFLFSLIFPFSLSLSFSNRAAHPSKLRVPTNQQAVDVGPVPAARRAGAAEAAAAPPSEPQPRARHGIARHHGSVHPVSLVLLKAPGPPVCLCTAVPWTAAPPHPPPPPHTHTPDPFSSSMWSLQPSESQWRHAGLWWLSEKEKTVVVQREDFQGLFCFFIFL